MKRSLFLFMLCSGLFLYQLNSQPVVELQKVLPVDVDDNDQFGSAISIDEEWALVSGIQQDNDGSVYVLRNDNGIWTYHQKIKKGPTDVGTGFGKAVSLDDHLGVIGYWYADEYAENSGCAYIIENQNGNWQKTVKLLPDTGFSQNRFGNAVDISYEYVIVGAEYESRNGYYGAAYIFHQEDDGTWELQEKLTAPDSKFGDGFGYSVGISENYAMVGAKNVDDNGINSGAVYIYERSGKSWQQIDKVYASDSKVATYFGHSLSMEGDFAIIGAPSTETNIKEPYGKAYIFEYFDQNWQEIAKLEASDQSDGDEFGYAVSISCDRAIVGAWYTDDGGTSAGSAYLFSNYGGWIEDTILRASDAKAFNLFGSSVDISCNLVMVGAPHNNENGSNAGAAYVFGELVTGGQNLAENNITLYPNPAQNMVTVDNLTYGIKEITLFNATGSIVYSETTNSSKVKLDLSGYTPGLYAVSIRTANGVNNFKLMKQK